MANLFICKLFNFTYYDNMDFGRIFIIFYYLTAFEIRKIIIKIIDFFFKNLILYLQMKFCPSNSYDMRGMTRHYFIKVEARTVHSANNDWI